MLGDEILHLRQRAIDLPDNAEPFEQVVGGIYGGNDMNPFKLCQLCLT